MNHINRFLILIFIFTATFSACKKNDIAVMKKADYKLYSGYFNGDRAGNSIYKDNQLIIVNVDAQTSYFNFIRLDENGNEIVHNNQQFYSATQQYDVAVTSAGRIFTITTNIPDWSTTRYNIWVIELNENGDTIQSKSYGGPLGEIAMDVKKTSDGGFLVAGYVQPSGSSGLMDIFLLKIDANGNKSWYQSYYTNTNFSTVSLAEMHNGNIIAIGSSNTGGFYLLKTDATGNKIDELNFTESSFAQYKGVEVSASDEIFCFGNMNGDVHVVKLSENLKKIWTKEMGYSNQNEFIYNAVDCGDNSFILTGTSSGPLSKSSDILTMKINSDGENIWYRSFGGTNVDYAINAVRFSNGIITLMGNTNSFNGGSTVQMFLLRMNASGEFL